MINLDIDSPKNREKALADFNSLIKHPGWSLITAIVTEQIEYIKDKIVTGGENETVESINRLRDELKVHERILNIPKYWIEKLEPTKGTEQNEYDPYARVPEVNKKK